MLQMFGKYPYFFCLFWIANLNALKSYMCLNIVTFKNFDLILHLTLNNASRPY